MNIIKVIIATILLGGAEPTYLEKDTEEWKGSPYSYGGYYVNVDQGSTLQSELILKCYSNGVGTRYKIVKMTASEIMAKPIVQIIEDLQISENGNLKHKNIKEMYRLVKCYDAKKNVFEYCLKIGEGQNALIYKRLAWE